MKLSIIHALAPAPFGGLESVVLTLAAAQARQGHRVTVVGAFDRDPSGQPFWMALQQKKGVQAIPLLLQGRQYLAERAAMREVLREVEADVLHTHGYRPDIVLVPFGRSMGVARVSTVHGFTSNDWKDRLYEWLQRWALRRTDAVVAVSRKLGTELERSGVREGRLHVIPNAWAPQTEALGRSEAREVLDLPAGGCVIGWVGRLSEEKAPELAIDALREMDTPDARLSFVGDGPRRTLLERYARSKGIEERVYYHGMVPGAARYLRAFDALLITSWTEGTPVVLLEAMATEVPVVTTAVGGIPDVVSPEEARLVGSGDTAGMARALDRICVGDPDSVLRTRRAKSRLHRDFSIEPWVRRYDMVYASCVASTS